MKKLTYFVTEIIALIFLAIFDWLITSHIANVAREVFTVFFLFIIPGELLINIFKIKLKHVWEYLLIAIGLSTTFLLFGGLIANFLIPAFGVHRSLELFPLLYFFNIAIFLLIGISALFPKENEELEELSNMHIVDLFFGAICLIFPVLSIFGAISLNNRGSNILIVVLLSLIPVVLIAIVACAKKLHEHTFYWFIFTTSVSLLLMLSLRSWHIAGSDINEEYRIFQITKHAGFWDPYFNHAYNACISLTILPTIISLFTAIKDEYIYKIVFQVLFSLTPIALFSLYRNFANKVVSLLAVFYVIAQPFFIQPMTALIRQEVALFFFTLALTVVFSKSLRKITANILFILFGMSMIVSHYSTSYIAMGLFISSYIMIALFMLFKGHLLIKKIYTSFKNLTFNFHITHSIQSVPLLILIAFTYFWFFQFTQTSGNLTGIFTQTISNLKNIGKEKVKNDETTKALSVFSKADTTTYGNITNYVNNETNSFKNSPIEKYNVLSTDQQLYPITIESVPPLRNSPVNSILNNFLEIIKTITKVIVFLGPLLLLLRYFHKDTIDKEYISLTIVGIALVGLVIVHPTLGESYNLSRIYLQILIIASLGGILFITDIIPKVGDTFKYILVSVLLSFMFILFSGLSAQFIGGTAYMHLNNFGDDYDKFYTHDQEVKSAIWLSKNYDRSQFIFTDEISNLRLQSFANITTAFPIVIPSAMYKNSYVYARTANIIRLRTDVSTGGLHLLYSFPLDFLNENKNLVYNNGGSRIYR